MERMLNSKGSVGRLIPNPNPTSFIPTESGVQNIASITSLSREKMLNKATTAIRGNNDNQ